MVLRTVAIKLHETGMLTLDEGFIDGNFASAKKVDLTVWKTRGAKG